VGGTITGLNWNFGGNGTATGTPVTHSFTSAGTYNVRLIAAASNGCTDTAFQTVRVNPQPQVSFTAPADQCLGGNVFTFTSSATIASGTLGVAQWNFGDNSTGTGSPVTHSYTSGGDYSVKLEVSSDKGCIDSTRRTVSVFEDPIVSVSAARPLTFCQGDSVILQANAQAGSGILVSYQWFNGGNLINGATGTMLVVKNTGIYTVRVVNSNGCDSTSIAVAVTVNPLPVGNLQLPSVDYICTGTPVS
jgi:hypothetical protein